MWGCDRFLGCGDAIAVLGCGVRSLFGMCGVRSLFRDVGMRSPFGIGNARLKLGLCAIAFGGFGRAI